ncbi:hypothetical protein BHAOGJBA_4208 [Methylobacterium hispanicum]|uniref:DoxX family protein n=1 Tax=Methylobacterium hispanicum TaxID=270350 RepID=A0AAV4ZPZ3_9HYPH|nr:hypothetical protein [Methylobacterium hispanicum]GJD90666.1 hypothetical protein BHAOGJBA_4208 [Methylobacterium hispanicum]
MRSLRNLGLPLLAGLLVNAWGSGAALAHVKWFCAYDLSGSPRGLEQVLCPDFEKLVALSLGALILGCCVEYSPLGATLLRSLDRSTAWVRSNIETVFRATAAFFLVSLWNVGGIILTPELKTDLAFVSWIQLGMAVCLLWRATLPVVSVGIVCLFAYALTKYGAFHLADYPVFLGVAAYLALTGLGRTAWGARPVDVLRWSGSITLMWASVEKWAYPEWSFPLLQQKPQLAFGFSPETFMLAAGVVEFVLAFALIWTPLVRRAAAAVLIGIFVSAVWEFGKVDAIGHALIVAALLAVLVDDAPAKVRVRHVALAPFAYGAALALFMFIYYAGHRMVFNVI